MQGAAFADRPLATSGPPAALPPDQLAGDQDEAAGDNGFADGGGSAVRHFARDIRARGALQRRQTADERAEAAAARDAVAQARDLAAAAREETAELHDRELATTYAATAGSVPAEELLERVLADRAMAADSRARAASDRERSAWDRSLARADRDVLLTQLAAAETDMLTGTRTRDAGLNDLDREIDRARRTGGALAVVFVDVVGLKAVNDFRGHAAGDTLIQRVAQAIRKQLRSYDLMVRLGGDEFLCALSGATEEEARRRMRAVQTELARGDDPCQIRTGFATRTANDRAADLIARADADLPARQRPPTANPGGIGAASKFVA